MFFVNEKDGSITAKKLVKGKHKVIIRARDKGSPQRQTDVTCYVSVHPRSVSPPKFSILSYFKTLSENAKLKTVVAKIGNPLRRIKYQIVGGNTGNTFNILRNGVVLLARPLDYERVRDYNLVVRAVYRRHGGLELAFEV